MLHFVLNLDIDLDIVIIQIYKPKPKLYYNVLVAFATECIYLEIFTDRTEKSFSCGLLFTYLSVLFLFCFVFVRGNWAAFVTETTKTSQ